MCLYRALPHFPYNEETKPFLHGKKCYKDGPGNHAKEIYALSVWGGGPYAARAHREGALFTKHLLRQAAIYASTEPPERGEAELMSIFQINVEDVGQHKVGKHCFAQHPAGEHPHDQQLTKTNNSQRTN